MSCPTRPELVAIVKMFGTKSNDDAAAQRKSLLKLDERLKSAGPFLRVLLNDDDSFESYEQETKSALGSLSIGDLNVALRTIESDEIDGVPPRSHRVARYVTPKARDGDYITKELRPASDIVTLRIRDLLQRSTVDDLRNMVLSYETETANTESNPKALETLLQKYICSVAGLRWNYGHSRLTLEKTGNDTISKKAHEISCQKTCVSWESPVSSTMEKNTLYQPRDGSYPFVDLLWVEKDDSAEEMRSILAAQCSVSPTHAKFLHVYRKLRERLRMPEDQWLIVYMATIPRCVESYLTGPTSTYFEGTTKRNTHGDLLFTFPKNIEFRVFLPDTEMKNIAPSEADYKTVLDSLYSEPGRQPPARSSRSKNPAYS
jgi:hypothetical protein